MPSVQAPHRGPRPCHLAARRAGQRRRITRSTADPGTGSPDPPPGRRRNPPRISSRTTSGHGKTRSGCRRPGSVSWRGCRRVAGGELERKGAEARHQSSAYPAAEHRPARVRSRPSGRDPCRHRPGDRAGFPAAPFDSGEGEGWWGLPAAALDGVAARGARAGGRREGLASLARIIYKK